MTFDDEIRCREEDLSLKSDVYGTLLLPRGLVLMEIKCVGGIPLWMTKVLSSLHIYKSSFSKYGTAYDKSIYPEINPKASENSDKEINNKENNNKENNNKEKNMTEVA